MKAKIVSLLLFLTATAFAQSGEEKEQVMKPIRNLFEGMQKGDSALARSAFDKSVTTATLGTDKTGKPFIFKETSVNGFMKAIGTPHPENWNEVIWTEKVMIDGNFAEAWMSYAFYVGKKFSHCGVDAFHLMKGTDGAWKIFHLADTRQKEGCKIPPKISKQFE